jgi:hypothetical protein
MRRSQFALNEVPIGIRSDEPARVGMPVDRRAATKIGRNPRKTPSTIGVTR